MKIPNKLKVGGFDYEIILDDLLKRGGNNNLGTHSSYCQKIFIDKLQHQEQKEETFIHEMIEAINRLNNLELPHQTISILSFNLYSILKNNNLLK